MVLDFPRPDRCTHDDWNTVLRAVATAQTQTGQPIAILASLVAPSVAADLIAQGIMTFCGLPEAIKAIETATFIGTCTPDFNLLKPPMIAAGQTLTEAAAKKALAQYGVGVPISDRATAEDLVSVANEVGYPVVLKGEGIAH